MAVRSVLVTGATSGIGRASAVALAAKGWRVLAAGRDPERGAEVAAELGDRGEFVPDDLADPEAPERLVSAAAAIGRLGAVVNNAGVHLRSTVVDTDLADYERVMAINVRAAFLVARAAVPVMRDQGGGVVVNVASESGLVATPGQIVYNLSKATLVMLTKSLAADHAADGIRAVTVCPGTTRTPMVEDILARDPDRERVLAGRRPANRLGDVEEVAAAVAFAVSDEVAFMTGTELVLDGGFTAV